MNETYNGEGKLVIRRIREMLSVYRESAKALELSDGEFWVWYTLVTIEGEHTQQDICAMWSLPKQTVNTVITRMRLKKYAYLEAIPRTRNHKIVRLTEEGRRYGRELILPITQAEEKALSRISDGEHSVFGEIFDKYIELIRTELKQTVK